MSNDKKQLARGDTAFRMDNPKRYIIGQSHDARGNLANYHVVALWPCVVAGCSRNRLTRILWIEPKR